MTDQLEKIGTKMIEEVKEEVKEEIVMKGKTELIAMIDLEDNMIMIELGDHEEMTRNMIGLANLDMKKESIGNIEREDPE